MIDESNLVSLIESMSTLELSMKTLNSSIWADRLFIFKHAIASPRPNKLEWENTVLELCDAGKELTDTRTAIS